MQQFCDPHMKSHRCKPLLTENLIWATRLSRLRRGLFQLPKQSNCKPEQLDQIQLQKTRYSQLPKYLGLQLSRQYSSREHLLTYSQVSIKQASSLNYFEEIFHPACPYQKGIFEAARRGRLLNVPAKIRQFNSNSSMQQRTQNKLGLF